MTNRPIDDWMWKRALTLLDEAERLSQGLFGRTPSRSVWHTPVDVFRDGGEVVVWAALPGVAAEHVEVTLNGSALKIRASRKLAVEPSRAVIQRLEIPYGRFERVLDLGDGAYSIIEHRVLDGCLRLRLRHD